MTHDPHRAYLIVNADDYGYFRCVSGGILEAASRGVVSATGVIANRDGLQEQAEWLKACDHLDTGIHLNLTAGVPISAALRQKCARWSGAFPGKYAMVTAVLSGAIPVHLVADEWRSQIERCLAAGLRPVFLNSHEHIHMLPPLFGVATVLAGQYGISHVRVTTAERSRTMSAGALLRNTLMRGMQLLSARRASPATAQFLGLDPSGKLGLDYFRRTLPSLQPGAVYELMCHPGRLDRTEVQDAQLLAYHDWEGELATLTSPELTDLLDQHHVSVIGYRDLGVCGDRLEVTGLRRSRGRAEGPTTVATAGAEP